ncbi:glycosyltransferase [Arenimonas aestuarii]
MSQSPTSPGEGNAAALQGEFPVVPGRHYGVRIDARDVAGSVGPKALIAAVSFHDDQGAALPGVPPGCSKSDRYGAFVYLPSVVDGEAPRWADAVVGAPEGAATVRLQVIPWKASTALKVSGVIEFTDERELALASEAFEVAGGHPYRVSVGLADESPAERAAVIALDFYDGQGQLLPGPFAGTSQSARFGAFRYAGVRDTGDTAVAFNVASPDAAVRLVVRVHRWQGSKALALTGPIAVAEEVIEGLDSGKWRLAGPEGVELEAALPAGPAGLVALDIGYRAQGPGSTARLSFLDENGHPVVAEEGGDAATLALLFDLRESENADVRRLLAWRPEGARSVRLKAMPGDQRSVLALERQFQVAMIEPSGTAARACEVAAPCAHFEKRERAFNAWQCQVRLDGFRRAMPGAPAPELTLFFGDAAGKTVAPGDSLVDRAATPHRLAGNAYRVACQLHPSGSAALDAFSVQVRLRPPAGATTLVARVTNGGSQEDLFVSLVVQPMDTLVAEAVNATTAAQLLAMEEVSPAAARQTFDLLLEKVGHEVPVMAAGMDLCRRLGDVTRLEELAARALSTQGAAAGKLRMKAKHALAVVRELDTHWLPDPGAIPAGQAVPDGGQGLRVAHLFKTTLPYENTGGAIRCLNIVKFQKQLGMRPLVITPLAYPGRGGTGGAWEREDVEGIPHFRLNGLSREDVRTVPSTRQLDFTALLTAHLLREQGVDIVQASSGYRGYEQALVGLAVARRLGVPFVYEVRSYHEHTWRRMADWVMDTEMTRGRMAQEDRCMREADAVVTICETMKEGLVARGIPAEKIFVVPNSVDLDHFKPQAPDPALREQLGLSAATTVGYISNVSAREGHAVLLRAVAQARAQGADMDCLIVGGGPELDRLKELATALGIAGHVVFTGEVPHDEVENYYALIDIFVVPRVADFASDFVTPMKPFEAMAMGRPVIISDRPALREIVEPGVRGQMFPAGDAAALSALLLASHADPSALRRQAEAGMAWVKTDREWSKTIRIYEDIYRLAESSHGGRKA